MRLTPFSVLLIASLFATTVAQAQTYTPNITLLRADETLSDVRLLTIDSSMIRVRTPDGSTREFPRSTCIGYIVRNAESRDSDNGIVVLTDGQRFPGRVVTSEDSDADEIVWDHRWLGELRFPLRTIDWIAFDADAERPLLREWDTVILSNGDRVEGFIVSIGSLITIELEDETTIDIPIGRIRAIRFVNPQQSPADDVARIWVNNGSVYDITDIALGDDGLYRLASPVPATRRDEFMHHVSHVTGVVFDADSLVPLASVEPIDVEGPETRFVVPTPRVSDERTPLDLQPITLHGPLTVRYPLPKGGRRLLLRARLADQASPWADTELILRVDGREVARSRLNRSAPTALINVPIDGAEVAIELTEGAHGPVRDQVILEDAMVLRSGE